MPTLVKHFDGSTSYQNEDGSMTPVSEATQPGALPIQLSPNANPAEKFSTGIMNILQKAQGLGGNQGLYERQTELQRKAIATESEETPDDLKVLSPEQQARIRQAKVSALEPEIDAVSSAIKASNDKLRNFESMLETYRQTGMDLIKLSPSQEVIDGYRNMIRQGGSPSSIPDEVRGLVVAKLTTEDWNSNRRANAASSSGTASEREASARAKALNNVRNDLRKDTGADSFVSPNEYRRLRDTWQWGNEDFEKEFPIEQFISPRNRTGSLKPRKSFEGASSGRSL